MTTYDDKTKGAMESGRCFILPKFKQCDEATFKASYIVASDVKCDGKITSLFDLIVLGSIEAAELDVKGKFVCLGKCDVKGTILVQNEIWVNDVRAKNIETNDRIVAQEIDGETIIADGSIVVGKILAVEKLAKSGKNILCGETAYGSGKVVANTIITGEPLDLDEGEEAIVSSRTYTPSVAQTQSVADSSSKASKSLDLISYGETEYAPLGNFRGYLDFLISVAFDYESKDKYARWRVVLEEAERVCQSGIGGYSNIALVIWLTEITTSSYFQNWDKITDLFDTFEKHFRDLVEDSGDFLTCSIDSYSDWLEALSILSRFGALVEETVSRSAFELVVSNLGLKAKFVSDRLNEKGWQANG